MNIDWSKAPEGATHFSEGNPRNGKYPAWWRPVSKCDDLFECWAVGTSFGCEAWQPGPFHLPEKAIKREWTGKGLPPIGPVCEFRSDNRFQWCKAEVVYKSDWVIVVRGKCSKEESVEIAIDVAVGSEQFFRPIRMPEQIAAEEREKKIKDELNELWDADTRRNDFIEAVYRLIVKEAQ